MTTVVNEDIIIQWCVEAAAATMVAWAEEYDYYVCPVTLIVGGMKAGD